MGGCIKGIVLMELVELGLELAQFTKKWTTLNNREKK